MTRQNIITLRSIHVGFNGLTLQVYVEPLKKTDLMFIATTMYPDIPLDILTSMVTFNMQVI